MRDQMIGQEKTHEGSKPGDTPTRQEYHKKEASDTHIVNDRDPVYAPLSVTISIVLFRTCLARLV